MKQILSLLTIGLVFVCLSCNNDKTDKTAGDTMSSDKKDNSMADKNLAVMHAVNDAFGTGNTGALDSIIADDFVDHTDRGDKMGRDSMKAMIALVRATNKDMKMEIKKELADNDYVMSWMRFTGTSDGSMGMPKGPYDMTAIGLSRFKDGKAVEYWEFMEPREMMKMMPQMPSTGKTDDKMKSK
jgi:predicted SnoaL-like aldol condensation-catalyzing enzyme